MYVEVSPDGMSWFTVFFNPASPNTTMPDDQQYVQISSFVGGYSQAYIRFVFSGFYYFWQLDDIAIVDTYANDLALRNSTYGDFDLFDPGHPTGFEFMEYSKYPESMPPLLKFSSTCDNVGANGQSNCKLQVDVQTLDGSSVLHSAESAEGIFLFPGASSELRAGTFQMPGTSGAYRVLYEPSQDQVEDFEENNLDTSVFFIDEVQYARDALFTSAVYLGLPEYENIQYEKKVLESISLLSKGDLRKSINFLQSLSLQSNHITLSMCYKTAGVPSYIEVKDLLENLLDNTISYNTVNKKIDSLIKSQGYSLSIVLKELVSYLVNNLELLNRINSDKLAIYLSEMSDLENRVIKSTFDDIYMSCLVGIFKKD
jgi:hypothetical protein